MFSQQKKESLFIKFHYKTHFYEQEILQINF